MSIHPILACDLGGTRMKIGVVRAGEILAQATEPVDSNAGLLPALPQLKSAWLKLLEELDFSVRDCAGISVAFPSLIDTKSGRVLAEYGKYADARAHTPWGAVQVVASELHDGAALVAGEWLLREQFQNLK